MKSSSAYQWYNASEGEEKQWKGEGSGKQLLTWRGKGMYVNTWREADRQSVWCSGGGMAAFLEKKLKLLPWEKGRKEEKPKKEGVKEENVWPEGEKQK